MCDPKDRFCALDGLIEIDDSGSLESAEHEFTGIHKSCLDLGPDLKQRY